MVFPGLFICNLQCNWLYKTERVNQSSYLYTDFMVICVQVWGSIELVRRRILTAETVLNQSLMSIIGSGHWNAWSSFDGQPREGSGTLLVTPLRPTSKWSSARWSSVHRALVEQTCRAFVEHRRALDVIFFVWHRNGLFVLRGLWNAQKDVGRRWNECSLIKLLETIKWL